MLRMLPLKSDFKYTVILAIQFHSIEIFYASCNHINESHLSVNTMKQIGNILLFVELILHKLYTIYAVHQEHMIFNNILHFIKNDLIRS